MQWSKACVFCREEGQQHNHIHTPQIELKMQPTIATLHSPQNHPAHTPHDPHASPATKRQHKQQDDAVRMLLLLLLLHTPPPIVWNGHYARFLKP